jgi:hypothetical protein
MPFSDDEELLTERELKKHINRSQRQLQRDRAERRGIPFVQLENQIRYRRGDVRAYVAQHLVGLNARPAEHSGAAAATLKPRQLGGPRTARKPRNTGP